MYVKLLYLIILLVIDVLGNGQPRSAQIGSANEPEYTSPEIHMTWTEKDDDHVYQVHEISGKYMLTKSESTCKIVTN
jgi:hypothetical protein